MSITAENGQVVWRMTYHHGCPSCDRQDPEDR